MQTQTTHIHFLHLPKTGGSAVRNAFKRSGLLSTEHEQRTISYHPHKKTLADIPIGEQIMFTLRDPIDRFVSAFFYCKNTRNQHAFEKFQLKNFATPNDLAACLEINNPNHRFALRALKKCLHMRCFRYWYVNKDYFNSRLNDIFFIGFTETLEVDFNNLKALLNVNSNIALSSEKRIANKGPQHVRHQDKIIQEPGLTLLREWYKEDIEFTILCKEIMASRKR